MSARNPRIGTTTGSDVTVTRVTFGRHAGGGKFTNAPRTVATDLKLSRDGAVAYGPWQTDGIEQNVEHLLGYDYTATGEVAGLVGSCWKTTSGTAADVAPALTTDWQTPLDIWVEAETYASTPVVAAFGDSLTCGVGNTWSVFDSWLSQYCRTHEALPIHYAASGDTAQSWAEDTSAYKWTRWDRHPAPDAVIWALGSNDLGTGRSLDQLQNDTLAGVAEVRRKFPSPLFVANITPRDKWLVEGSDARRKQYNTWLLTQGWHRGVFDFSSAILDPATGGIKAALNGDGVHFNTAGYVAEAAVITPPVTAPPVLYKN